MTAHLVHASIWLVVLCGEYLCLRGRRRRQVARLIGRRWTSARRTAAALRRGLTFHPRQPQHASPERTA